ncbi:MAG: hypothetical protein ACOWWH_12740 [Eubacteriaceae bacterium]
MWSALLFVAGLFTYKEFLDKPETIVNNKIGKIKNKGENNDISTYSTTEVQQDNSLKKEKKKFRLFGKKS